MHEANQEQLIQQSDEAHVLQVEPHPLNHSMNFDLNHSS